MSYIFNFLKFCVLFLTIEPVCVMVTLCVRIFRMHIFVFDYLQSTDNIIPIVTI